MAFRDNEASLVSAVLAARAANDTPALLAAARAFWLAPPERPDEPDASAREVWEAIVAAGQVEPAIATALAVIRAGEVVRAHAYIDLVEAIGEPEVLVELAALALAKQRRVVPYLAAPIFVLVDRKREDVVRAFIDTHEAPLFERTEPWILIGVILTTTHIGDRGELASWFVNFAARPGVPMWLLHAFMGTLLQIGAEPMSLVDLARQIDRSTLRDATFGMSLSLMLVDFLRFSALDAFFELYDRERAALRPLPLADEPLVAYVNAARHARPIVDDRAPHARWTAKLLRESHAWIELVARILPFFALLRDAHTPAEVVAAFRAMQRAAPAALPSIRPAWNRLLRGKAGPLTRLRLAYFG